VGENRVDLGHGKAKQVLQARWQRFRIADIVAVFDTGQKRRRHVAAGCRISLKAGLAFPVEDDQGRQDHKTVLLRCFRNLADIEDIGGHAERSQFPDQLFEVTQRREVRVDRLHVQRPQGVIVKKQCDAAIQPAVLQPGGQPLEHLGRVGALVVTAPHNAVGIDDRVVQLLGAKGKSAELEVGDQGRAVGGRVDDRLLQGAWPRL